MSAGATPYAGGDVVDDVLYWVLLQVPHAGCHDLGCTLMYFKCLTEYRYIYARKLVANIWQ